jgi:hypothetical protein
MLFSETVRPIYRMALARHPFIHLRVGVRGPGQRFPTADRHTYPKRAVNEVG